MRRRQGRVLNQELNITNLVDVVFTLLIVFMITAPLMNQGIKVNLPKVQATSMNNEKPVRVTINANNEVFVEDQKSSVEELKKVFPNYWKQDLPVVVNSDESVSYGVLIKVVSEIQNIGVTKIGFLTRPPEPKK